MPTFDNSMHVLSGISLLVEASPEKITQLEGLCDWLEYDANDVVIDLHDDSTSIFFIVKGKLKVLDFMDERQVVALADVNEGDTIGELSAIDLKVRSAKVTAAAPSLLARLPSKDFRNLLLDCPQISLALLKQFSGFIRTMNSRVTSLSTLSVHQRIYFELLRMAEPNTQGDGSWIISQAPHHNDIAAWSGAERQDVAEAIGKLARDGVIERKHKMYLIRDYNRLKRLANQ